MLVAASLLGSAGFSYAGQRIISNSLRTGTSGACYIRNVGNTFRRTALMRDRARETVRLRGSLLPSDLAPAFSHQRRARFLFANASRVVRDRQRLLEADAIENRLAVSAAAPHAATDS